MVDIVDEYGNPAGETVERAKAHSEGIRHRTAHVWIIRRNGKKDRSIVAEALFEEKE